MKKKEKERYHSYDIAERHMLNLANQCCVSCGVTAMALYYGRDLPWSGCQMKGERKRYAR
jgi:hypothetical protein